MKIIALGGSGMTGCYLPKDIPNFSRSTGHDITNLQILEHIFQTEKPDAVLHLAAVTDVVGAENDYLKCYQINTIGAYFVARMCKKYSADMCLISSVDVFNGQKETPYEPYDKKDPIVEYGHSKSAAEDILIGYLKRPLILRAGWMFGGGVKDKKFVSYIIKQIREGQPEIKAVNDTVGSATFGKDLINTALQLMRDRTVGIYHVCNTGVTTRYQEAKIITELLGYTGKVTPVSSKDFPNFRTLQNASMNPSVPMRGWEEALTEYIKESYV